jgi:4-hydroxybenzoate polyprenyltransferase
MRVLLFLLAILALLAGAGILTGAQSAIHEIEAFILFLISAVFMSGAGVVEAVNLLRKETATVKKPTSTN